MSGCLFGTTPQRATAESAFVVVVLYWLKVSNLRISEKTKKKNKNKYQEEVPTHTKKNKEQGQGCAMRKWNEDGEFAAGAESAS